MANVRQNNFILLALLLGCFSLSQAQPRSDREADRLRGPVKSVQWETAKVSNVNGELTESRPIVSAIDSYDTRGSITEQISNDASGARRSKHGWAYTYDAEGREIRKEYLDSNGRVTSIGITRYNKNGSELTQHNPDGSVNHIWQSFFDDKGLLIRDVRRYPTGLAWEHLYKYDSDGRQIERVNRELGGKVIDRSVMTYDDHGTQASWIVEKADGTSIQMFKCQFGYDADGNITERRSYDPDGSLFQKDTYKYEFDEQGNWVKRTTERQKFSRKALTYEQDILYRRIKYF